MMWLKKFNYNFLMHVLHRYSEYGLIRYEKMFLKEITILFIVITFEFVENYNHQNINICFIVYQHIFCSKICYLKII